MQRCMHCWQPGKAAAKRYGHRCAVRQYAAHGVLNPLSGRQYGILLHMAGMLSALSGGQYTSLLHRASC